MEENTSTPSQGASKDTRTIVTVLLLIFVYPLGFFFMWFWTKWPVWVKVVISFPVIAVLLTVLLVSIGGSKGSSTTGPEVVTPNQNQMVSPAATEDLTPKVGATIKLGDREFTVNSVKREKSIGYSSPKANKEYVVVNVTIKNLGKDEVTYNPFDFKVQDANGAQETETFATLDDSLNSGTLAPGGKVTGSIPFEVPEGDKALLIFQPSFWSNQRIVVDLGDK